MKHQPSPRTLRRWLAFADLAQTLIESATERLLTDTPDLGAIEGDLADALRELAALHWLVEDYRKARRRESARKEKRS